MGRGGQRGASPTTEDVNQLIRGEVQLHRKKYNVYMMIK